ncbi:hypothetical protein OPQ81_004900 [Rhizoctonia solani]|nr:hypothetical protein OPQ81_004900 [Rhizoctonia solani]
MNGPDFLALSEDDAELLLRKYYTLVVALRRLPPELILHICRLAKFTSPWPDRDSSAIFRHQPSRFQRQHGQYDPANRSASIFACAISAPCKLEEL